MITEQEEFLLTPPVLPRLVMAFCTIGLEIMAGTAIIQAAEGHIAMAANPALFVRIGFLVTAVAEFVVDRLS